ncbi:MAG: hypothetical protein K2J90_09235 [Lachnospiraceae bacterium]|nr:hypothetical protein [Lachnospiraceae bacterium]
MKKRIVLTILVAALFLISFSFVIFTGKEKNNETEAGALRQTEVVNFYEGAGGILKETYSSMPD